jgi:hypothetical protein
MISGLLYAKVGRCTTINFAQEREDIILISSLDHFLKTGQFKRLFSPAQLLDAAHIHNPIMKMCRESLHVLIKKPLVHVHGISCQGARALGCMLLNECQHFIFQFG